MNLLPTGTYHFDIIKTEERQSRFGRYGYIFQLQPIRVHQDVIMFHAIWFGKYKDFRYDSRSKSTKIWRMAKSFTNSINISMRDLIKNKKINQSFIAEVIKYEEPDYGYQNKIVKIIS